MLIQRLGKDSATLRKRKNFACWMKVIKNDNKKNVKTSKKCQKKWELSSFFANFWQGQTAWSLTGQVPLSYKNTVSCTCALKHWRQTGHVLLFQTLPSMCVTACWLQSTRDHRGLSETAGASLWRRLWMSGRRLPRRLHPTVPAVTVANAVLTSVMTYFAVPPQP